WCAASSVPLWVNLHGGVLLGVLVLGGSCVALELETRLGWTPRRIAPWEVLAIPLLAIGLLAVNPYGTDWYLHTLRQATFPWGPYIREFQPLWKVWQIAPWEILALVVLGGIAALGLVFL